MKILLLTITILFFMNITTNSQGRMNADTRKTTLNWLGEKVLGQHTGTVTLREGGLLLKITK